MILVSIFLQGVVICLLSSAGQPVNAVIVVNMKGACLELNRMDGPRQKSHVTGLQDALDKLPELAATHTQRKPCQPPVYSLHADTFGVSPGPGDLLDASAVGAVHQHYTQQKLSPISRVLQGGAMRSNKVAPLADEYSARLALQAPSILQLPLSSAVIAQPHLQQLQDSLCCTDATEQAYQSPQRVPAAAAAAAADPSSASACRSPFARTSFEQEQENQRRQRALELIRVARAPAELWAGLRQIKADRGAAKSDWADEWIFHEALEVP